MLIKTLTIMRAVGQKTMTCLMKIKYVQPGMYDFLLTYVRSCMYIYTLHGQVQAKLLSINSYLVDRVATSPVVVHDDYGRLDLA